ncbi:hypothetical protein V8G54_008282 [Vigna mungo]|uniref:Uncharacterized protein n=1 Tax=Vigna mungo TaxID=3915 RepID=A0AAQ3P3J1_VIGMU
MASFEDSLTDTGNLNFISPPQSPNCLLPPYGQTHFHRPTEQCSDGRLILDFLGTEKIPIIISLLLFLPTNVTDHHLSFYRNSYTKTYKFLFNDYFSLPIFSVVVRV